MFLNIICNTVEPLYKGQEFSTKLQNFVNFHAPFFTNHIYFTPYERPPSWTAFIERGSLYIVIHAPYTSIVVFWHISNIPPMISYSQIYYDTPMLYIATIFVKYCYTTGSLICNYHDATQRNFIMVQHHFNVITPLELRCIPAIINVPHWRAIVAVPPIMVLID